MKLTWWSVPALLAVALAPTLSIAVVASSAGTVEVIGRVESGHRYRWTELDPSTRSPGRYGGNLVFHRELGELVMSGGYVESQVDRTTWAWNGRDWRNTRAEAPAVVGRTQAYDPIRRQIVQFGGDRDEGNPLDETWTFDGEQWLQREPAMSPPAQYNHAIAFDPALGKVVVVSRGVSGMWAWDGTTWAELHPEHMPEPRDYAALAHDRASERLVLHGGYTAGGYVDTTWTWDGDDWTKLTTDHAPPASSFAAVSMGRHVVTYRKGELWQFRRGDWRVLETGIHSPGGKIGAAQMGYDPLRRELVLFAHTPDGTVGPDVAVSTWVLRQT